MAGYIKFVVDEGGTERTFRLPFSKVDATVSPGVSNDNTEGYEEGSLWVNVTDDEVWTCVDNSTGAAVWVQQGGGGGSGTVTSVDVSGGTTGLTTSGGPITTSGTITISGTLSNANGGTGADLSMTGPGIIGQTSLGAALGVLTTATYPSLTELSYVKGVTSAIQTQFGNKQPLDATLTAFAALTIAANSLTIGTGADAFSQTTFAANTFPARASTGDLVAKTITDAALTVLDDTTVAAMVNTLGGATSSGTGGLVRIDSATLTGTPAAPTASPGTNTTQIATTAFVAAAVSSGAVNPNLLYNPDFRIAQRGAGPFTSATTPANNDYTVLLDCWRLLSDGNDIVDVSQSLTPGSISGNTLYAKIAFDVETANKKFGIIHWLESKDTLGLRGQTVSLSCLLQTGASGDTFNDVKIGLIESVATADVTADPISSWNTGGTNPTLAANFSFIGTPVSQSMSSGNVAEVKLEGVTLTATGTNNLGVIIWSDTTSTTVGHLLYVSKVKLEISATATKYSQIPLSEQLLRCQRFFVSLGGSTNRLPATGRADGISTGFWTYPLGVKMRSDPSLSIAGTGSFQLNDGSVQLTASSISTNYSTTQCIAANFGMSASTFTLYRTLFGVFTDTTTYLWASAEL